MGFQFWLERGKWCGMPDRKKGRVPDDRSDLVKGSLPKSPPAHLWDTENPSIQIQMAGKRISLQHWIVCLKWWVHSWEELWHQLQVKIWSVGWHRQKKKIIQLQALYCIHTRVCNIVSMAECLTPKIQFNSLLSVGQCVVVFLFSPSGWLRLAVREKWI